MRTTGLFCPTAGTFEALPYGALFLCPLRSN